LVPRRAADWREDERGTKDRRKSNFPEPNPFAVAGRLDGERGILRFPGQMERAMRVIRYKAKPESADKNAELIAAVFAELKDAKPAGLRYLSVRLEDDSFIHFVETDAEDGSSALPKLASFQAFQNGIRDRCVEPPLVKGARIVGNYRMLETE
jgi:hypothetical protein